MSKDMQINAGSINRDNAHMLISIPPQLSVLRAVQFLTGKKLVQIALAVRTLEGALLGPVFVGSGVLGGKQWERYR